MIATDVDAGADADGAFRRFERAGKLLRLGVGNFVTFQKAPRAGDFAEPLLHLGDDEAAELHVGKFLGAEDGNGDEAFSRGGVGGSDFAHHCEIVDWAGAVAVESKERTTNRRLVRGEVEAAHATRSGFGFADQVSGFGTFGGDDDGAGAKGFAAGDGDFIFTQSFDAGIEANAVLRKFLRVCAGMAPMPRAGTQVFPSESILKTNSNMRLEVFNSPSSMMPPRKGLKKCRMISGLKPSFEQRRAIGTLEDFFD